MEKLVIRLEESQEELGKATRFTLIGKLLTEKELNRRGVLGCCRKCGHQRKSAPLKRLIFEDLEEVEDPDWNSGIGRFFLRMMVAMDVSKPLIPGFWVPRRDRERVWAKVRYEKMADFYFACGRLGHVMRFCVERGTREVSGDRRRKFGLWLKAAPLRNKEGRRNLDMDDGHKGM
ncbi:hypothetical protein PTKIN_Ptkin17bG0041100 [Pterospermum kingtungense]